MPVDPSIAVASIRAAYDVAKKFHDTPLKAEYLQLMEQLQLAREEAFELQLALHEARARVREREEEAMVRASVTYDLGAYWTGEAREHGPDGPYCPRCRDTDSKLVRMTVGSSGYARCPNAHCKLSLQIGPEKDSPPSSSQKGSGKGSWI